MNIFDVDQIFQNAKERGEISSLESLVLLEKRQFDLPKLLDLANDLNERVNGKLITYVSGKKLYYTNICRAKCKLCSFYTLKNRKNAFSLDVDAVVQNLKRSSWVKQLVLQGGLNPDLDIAYHTRLLKEIKSRFPKIYIQGYSPTEISFLARRARTSPKDVLKQMKDAGLDSLGGDSAEVLNDKLRKKIRQDKLKVSDWVEVLKFAHKMNMTTSISLVVGHIETGIHVSEHLDLIRNIQNETGFITNLVISPFVPANTSLARERKISNDINFERLLYVASIARISIGSKIKNITLDWPKVKFDQIPQLVRAGVNDLGIVEYDSNEVVFKNSPLNLDLKKLESTLKQTGKVLMQRSPYTIKKPKFTYLNDAFIVGADLVTSKR